MNDVEQGVMKQLDQWNQYETTLQQLLTWLNDAENILKGYTELSTLEEKLEQLNNYQVREKITTIRCVLLTMGIIQLFLLFQSNFSDVEKFSVLGTVIIV